MIQRIDDQRACNNGHGRLHGSRSSRNIPDPK